MKKTLLAAALAVSGALLSTSAFAGGPAGGQLNITGKVTNTSCVLDSASQVVNVQLPSVDQSALASVNAVTGRTGFQMTVNSCASGNKVAVVFVPDSNTNSDGNLKNTSTDPVVTNAEVQLLDQNFRVINIANDTGLSSRIVTATGTSPVVLQYYAQYFAAQADTAPGALKAAAQFVMSYE